MAKSDKKPQKKTLENISHAKAYVTATFNNTIITITDINGRVLFWGSAGSSGFKGARKSTPYAATTAVETVAKKVLERGIKSIEVHVRGPGPGRDGAIRAFKAAGLNVMHDPEGLDGRGLYIGTD